MNKIVTERLSLFFGEKQVLNEVDIKIPAHKVTAIIGPSGCGKSVFLKCLNRMNDLIPNARVKGEVFFKGKNIYADEVDVVEIRRKIGMVFQKPNPFPKSVFDNAAYGLRIDGLRDKARIPGLVEGSLKAADLWEEVKDRLGSSALQLSGGQQQRLCIARALVVKPEVLLLDEPCSALDPKSTFSIEALIRRLKERYTIVLVTHNMQQAARVSDFTGFLFSGRLVEFDRTSKIFTNPKEDLTEDYISGRFG